MKTMTKAENGIELKQTLVIHFPFPVKQVGERSVAVECERRKYGAMHPDFVSEVCSALGEKAGDALIDKMSEQAERELLIQSITLENVML